VLGVGIMYLRAEGVLGVGIMYLRAEGVLGVGIMYLRAKRYSEQKLSTVLWGKVWGV
jgi:hypothetical protein